MSRVRAKRGIALVMALYLTAIVFVLGTFFIADQLNKSRSVFDYKDSKMALSSANLGLNYLLNYLGDLNNHWADAILVAVPGGGNLCAGTEIDNIAWGGGTFSFIADSNQFLKVAPAPNANANLFENDYTFKNLNIALSENKTAQISGLLQIFYNRNLAVGERCPGAIAANPYAITNIKITMNAVIVRGAAVLATRQIQWTGLRNVGYFAALYQCWTCWDVPGNKYPNRTEQTDTASWIGNGFQADSAALALGQNSSGDRQGSTLNSLNANQSPYGIGKNGIMQIDVTAGTNLPPPPALNALVMANNNINVNNPSGLASPLNGKNEANTGISAPLTTGLPFGPAKGGSTTTAPQVLLNDYASAANDSGCGGSVKTVFIASSIDVAPSNASGANGHAFEYDASGTGAHQTLEPPVADVTFNNNGTFSVTTTGYYSGKIIQQYGVSTPLYASAVQNGILYFAGFKNVRVHGQLTGSTSLSVVADQGEAFYDQNNNKITSYTDPSGNTVNLAAGSNSNNCIAPNPTLSNFPPGVAPFNPNSLLAATRYQSNLGETTSQGVDYWLPGSTQTVYAPGANSSCNSCLYDGTYYDANHNTTGYHVDDMNGQPITLDPNQTPPPSPCAACGWANTPVLQTTDVQGFYSTVFAPRPTFTNGTYNGNTILTPQPVYLMSASGTVLNQKTMAPYPGASGTADLQAHPTTTPDTLFYTRQFEQSEGNLTIAGDTGFQGQGNSLGLMARNYVILDDFVAGESSGPSIANSKSATGDYSLQVRATVQSTNKSMQWEGNVVQDQNANYAQDVYLNGDYVAMNNKYANGTAYQFTYTDQNGVQRTAQADSWQGAPIKKPGSGNIVSPLMTNSFQTGGHAWQFRLFGTSQAAYQDVVNVQNSNGTYLGYALERLDPDKSSLYGPPPGFPSWSFAQYQNLLLPAFYVTLSYSDLGALHSFGP